MIEGIRSWKSRIILDWQEILVIGNSVFCMFANLFSPFIFFVFHRNLTRHFQRNWNCLVEVKLKNIFPGGLVSSLANTSTASFFFELPVLIAWYLYLILLLFDFDNLSKLSLFVMLNVLQCSMSHSQSQRSMSHQCCLLICDTEHMFATVDRYSYVGTSNYTFKLSFGF